MTIESLTESFDRETLEGDPYRLVLTVMGSESETEAQAGPNGFPSDGIWHFDTECIEGDGSYIAIARRLIVLAGGELPLENVTDHVDVDADEAHLAFQLAGQSQRWDAKLEDDWVEPSVLSRFADLLDRVGKGRRFTYIDLGGQDCLIGCARAAERDRLAKETGLKVEWLR